MNERMRFILPLTISLSLAAFAPGCGDDDDDDDDDESAADAGQDAGEGNDAGETEDAGADAGEGVDAGPDAGVDCEANPELCPPSVYAIDVEVRAPDGPAQAGYIQAIDSSMFDGSLITNATALEYEGIPRLLTLGGHVLIGERTAPTLHSYAVGDDLALDETGMVSFLGQGATLIDIGHVLVDEHKAYYLIGPTLTAVVYDPSEMAIDDTFDLTSLQRPGFEGAMLLQGTFLFEHAVHGNRAFVSTLYSIGAQQLYEPNMTVAVFDTDADTVVGVIEDDRCYGPSTMVRDANGDIYVSSYSFSGGIYQAKGIEYKPTCILRINAGEERFDPDFFVAFPDLLEGRECTRWYPIDGRYSYGLAIELETLQTAPNTSRAVGEVWKMDIVEGTASRVEGLDPSSPFETLGYPDGHGAIVLGMTNVQGAFDRSTVYRLDPTDDSVTPLFQVDGLFRGFYPVR